MFDGKTPEVENLARMSMLTPGTQPTPVVYVYVHVHVHVRVTDRVRFHAYVYVYVPTICM